MRSRLSFPNLFPTSPPAVVAMTGDAPAAYAAAERLGAGRDDNGG